MLLSGVSRAPRAGCREGDALSCARIDRKSTRLNSSHVKISYAVFCLKKKRRQNELYRSLHHERDEHVCCSQHPEPADIYALSLHDALPIFGQGFVASRSIKSPVV